MFQASADSGSLDDWRKGLSARMRNLAPVLRDVGEMLRSSIDQNFAKGGRYGSEEYGGGPGRWAVSIRAREQGGQTLLDTRRLSQSVAYTVQGNRVTLGTNVIYGALHQFGGKIEAKSGGWLFFRIPVAGGANVYRKRSVTIPARPWLVLQREDVQEAVEMISAYVLR